MYINCKKLVQTEILCNFVKVVQCVVIVVAIDEKECHL